MQEQKVRLGARISHILLPVSYDGMVLAESFFGDIFGWEKDSESSSRIFEEAQCFKNPADGKKVVVFPVADKHLGRGYGFSLECESMDVLNEVLENARIWGKKKQVEVAISTVLGEVSLSLYGNFPLDILMHT
ncbi:MAG: hypothetical protein UY41_C0023G0007 [Candidatus Moranbacteria bacterium GW2011_GWE1_49_15]|nr:MAG: hypothetical protein UX75_C0039G0017 [Candidatus Moranbacteria bacterium GW2011_GWE2_47_10]KKW06492.1 MAG: hypothetical protein UY41_C0023G0007 [Candidatus Moranbacteria bacterium GW2011_GWE1_49_15]HBP01103.1 hypothetical protein [Candidatus Moranbacteria bacterium]